MNPDDKIEKAPMVPPFVRFVASAIPMVFDDSLSYYEALCALWKWLQDNVVNVINNNAAVTEDYIQLTKDMKEYMDNYFDNLDVQEEINNKLDAMVEDGTLQEIITTYIQANVTWTFNTVDDMKEATNLIDGSYACTLGYYEAGDGGGATYLITDTADVTKLQEELDNNLYATLIITDNTLNMKQIGCKADGITDNYDLIQRAIAFLDKGTLYFPAGQYAISSPIEWYVGKSLSVKGDGVENTKFIDICLTDDHIFFSSSLVNNGITYRLKHGISYKDFEIIGNEHARVGFQIDKVAWLHIENVYVRNISKRGTFPSSNMSCSILFAGQLCYCNNFSSPQNDYDTSYEHPHVAMWLKNSTSIPSINPTNNDFVNCKWENSSANLFLSYSDNNIFENCAIEKDASYDINISSDCRWNTFIGIGSEASEQSLRDNGYCSTFIGCYFASDITLSSHRSEFIGCSLAIDGNITISDNSFGSISNSDIFRSATTEGKGTLTGSPNRSTWELNHVYNYKTSLYEYWVAGRVGATINTSTLTFTNPYQRNCIFHLTNGSSDLTRMDITYNTRGSVFARTDFTQDVILPPSGSIKFVLNGGGSISNVTGWVQELH